MPHRRSKCSKTTFFTDTSAQLDALQSQVTRLEAMVASFEVTLVKYGVPAPTVVKTTHGERIAASTTQQGCSRRRPVQPIPSKTVVAPLSAHHPREFSPDHFSASLVLAEDLIGHVVGHGGRGLKQVSDLSDARVLVFSQEIDGHSECLVSIRGTDKQLGDALVVLEKRIARKRVSAPRKKKKSASSSGPVIAGPGPLPPAATCPTPPATSQPSIPPQPRQTTTPTQGRVRQSQPQRQAPLPPPTSASRTVAMGSPSRPTSQNRTPTVPSVRMASPEPTSSDTELTAMEVDHILALIGSENTGLPLSQRRELALQVWRTGEVVSTLDRWELNWDIFQGR